MILDEKPRDIIFISTVITDNHIRKNNEQTVTRTPVTVAFKVRADATRQTAGGKFFFKFGSRKK